MMQQDNIRNLNYNSFKTLWACFLANARNVASGIFVLSFIKKPQPLGLRFSFIIY